MLMPKKVKYRKQQRGRMAGKAWRGSDVSFGDYGLKAMEPCWLTDRQIEAARVAMTRFMPVMWFGLWLNVVSGIVLLIAYPTKALTNPVFYLKLGLIAVGLTVLRTLVRHAGQPRLPRTTKMLAAVSLVTWAATIGAGRFLAYTCTRIFADSHISC